FNLLQEGKVSDTCDAIAIIGPTKAFFEQEIKAISDYLDNGGHALIALDLNLKGADYAQELLPLLKTWHINAQYALIVDPLSKMLGVDAAVPILASFSKDHSITKDFQTNCYFPFSRPLEIIPGAPEGMNVQWLAQTTPKSWAVGDLKQLSSGQIQFQPGKDKSGPLTTVIAASGKKKDSKATKNTRMVVFSTSLFATNNFSRYGGNMDFFLNSVSWVLEDESLISIRAKEEGPGKVELSQKQGTFIFLLTVIVIPVLVFAGGIVIWAIRRKL
ncbi:MAG: Gldg family protein, partial [Bdellovibrionota bacterium]